MMSASAITPARSRAQSRIVSKDDGPTKAPTAPTSFESPPPKLLNKTKGNRTANPRAAPSRDLPVPCQPDRVKLRPIPTTNPLTVNQLGILRLRRSKNAATVASTAAVASGTVLNAQATPQQGPTHTIANAYRFRCIAHLQCKEHTSSQLALPFSSLV